MPLRCLSLFRTLINYRILKLYIHIVEKHVVEKYVKSRALINLPEISRHICHCAASLKVRFDKLLANTQPTTYIRAAICSSCPPIEFIYWRKTRERDVSETLPISCSRFLFTLSQNTFNLMRNIDDLFLAFTSHVSSRVTLLGQARVYLAHSVFI